MGMHIEQLSEDLCIFPSIIIGLYTLTLSVFQSLDVHVVHSSKVPSVPITCRGKKVARYTDFSLYFVTFGGT